jgi:hypothetical protein
MDRGIDIGVDFAGANDSTFEVRPYTHAQRWNVIFYSELFELTCDIRIAVSGGPELSLEAPAIESFVAYYLMLVESRGNTAMLWHTLAQIAALVSSKRLDKDFMMGVISTTVV